MAWHENDFGLCLGLLIKCLTAIVNVFYLGFCECFQYVITKFSFYVINVIKIQVAVRGCKAPVALLSTSYNVVTSLLR